MDILAMLGIDKQALENAKNTFESILIKIDSIAVNQEIILKILSEGKNGSDRE